MQPKFKLRLHLIEKKKVENKKLTFDLSYFIGKSYLIFQADFIYFQILSGTTDKIFGGKSKRLSEV